MLIKDKKREIKEAARLYREAEKELDDMPEHWNEEKYIYEKDTSRYDIKMDYADSNAKMIAGCLKVDFFDVLDMINAID